jgi:Immunity protein 26
METERTLKRQQRTVGAIVKIPLEDGFHTYARILKVKCAFYDARTKEELSIEEIIQKPILFFATVYDSAITKGYWEKIGKKLPLEEHLLITPPTYRQNVLNPVQFTIDYNKTSRPATKEECIGLESAAIWEYKGMERRLNDHYAGRYNEHVNYMHHAAIANYYNDKPIDYVYSN